MRFPWRHKATWRAAWHGGHRITGWSPEGPWEGTYNATCSAAGCLAKVRVIEYDPNPNHGIQLDRAMYRPCIGVR